MMKICLVLLILDLSQLLLVSSIDLKQVERGLYDLNFHLEQVAKNEKRPEVLIDVANQWLEAVKDTKPELIETIELFKSLQELGDESTCNRAGYNLINEYNLASKDLTKYGLRKVDQVAFKYMVEHAQLCLPRYVKLFQEQISIMDKDIIGRVKDITEYVVQEQIWAGRYNSINPYAQSLSDALDSGPIEFIFLMEQVADDPRSPGNDEEMNGIESYLINFNGDKFPSNREQLKKLLLDLVIQPCKVYDGQIGSNIYDLVMQDYKTLMDARRSMPTIDGGRQWSSKEFFLSMVYVKSCRLYVLQVGVENLINKLSTNH